MITLNEEDSMVLIIDIQEKLLNAVFNKEEIEANSEKLAKASTIFGLPIFITEQYPKGLGETIEGIKKHAKDAKYYEKTDFNALNDKKLLDEIKRTGKKQIIIAGIETHICVHQTVAGLIENGFEVTAISDICSSRDEKNYNAGLDCMKANGAKVKTLETVLFELLKGSRHPKFKDVQALIK